MRKRNIFMKVSIIEKFMYNVVILILRKMCYNEMKNRIYLKYDTEIYYKQLLWYLV